MASTCAATGSRAALRRRAALAACLVALASATQAHGCEAGAEGLCTELGAEAEAGALGLLQQRAAEHAASERRAMQVPSFGDIARQAQDAANEAVDTIRSQAQKASAQARDAIGSAREQAEVAADAAAAQAIASLLAVGNELAQDEPDAATKALYCLMAKVKCIENRTVDFACEIMYPDFESLDTCKATFHELSAAVREECAKPHLFAPAPSRAKIKQLSHQLLQLARDLPGPLAKARELTKNGAEQAKKSASEAATKAAVFAAQQLNNTLKLVGKQTGALVTECSRLRNLTLERALAAEPTVSARVGALEAATQDSVGKVLPVWDNITVAIKSAGMIASTSLEGLGAKELGDKVTAALDSTAVEGENVAAALRNLSRSVAGLENLEEAELVQRLRATNKTIDAVLSHTETYASSVLEAFDELTNKASDKIVEALGSVGGMIDTRAIAAAFSEVDITAEDVLGDVVRGPKELVAGVGEAAWLVESALPGEVRSAAPRSQAAVGLAAALAALAARA